MIHCYRADEGDVDAEAAVTPILLTIGAVIEGMVCTAGGKVYRWIPAQTRQMKMPNFGLA